MSAPGPGTTTNGSTPDGRGVVSWIRRFTDRRLASDRTPSVAILGAGFSGINTAIRLKQVGIHSFTIFEKAGRIGGTWRDNTYPGAACDVPSHLYCYSFEPKLDWSRQFAPQHEILEYLEHCVDKYGLREHIRFETRIVSAAWDDGECRWRLQTESGEEVDADVMVGATGQLNQPSLPNIDGVGDFRGTAFHSARWNHEHDLQDERVIVIGTGASAIQFVPEVARQASTLTIFQRSAPYVAPKADREFTATELRRFRKIVGWDRLYRWWIYWRYELRYLMFLRNSPMGRKVRELFSSGIREHVVSDELPEEAVIPDYPVGCNRFLISNDWYPALMRPNVHVITEPVDRVTERGVRTVDGVEHEADTLIYGTGFQATNFLGGLPVTGRDGRTLADAWSDGAEAHLGMTVAGFPNLFLLYGPNTNLGHNSVLFMVERQVEYLLQYLGRLAEDDANAIDVQAEAMRRSNDRVQSRLVHTVWAEACKSWYKTATGRITQNWSGPTVEYWALTKRMRRQDFEPLVRRAGAPSRQAPATIGNRSK